VAIANQARSAGASLVGDATLTQVVPVFVAAMVWLIRVLIIGTLSVAGDRLFSTAAYAAASPRSYPTSSGRPQVPSTAMRSASPVARPVSSFRPAPKPSPASYDQMEPTYQSLPLEAASADAGRERRLQ
jgi:hypothetical protein